MKEAAQRVPVQTFAAHDHGTRPAKESTLDIYKFKWSIDYWVMLFLLFGRKGIGAANISTSSPARGGKDDGRGKSTICLYGHGKAYRADASEAISAKDTSADTVEVDSAANCAPDPEGEADFDSFEEFEKR